MSYLSTALQRLAERRQMRPVDLARASGIDKSYLSRFFKGDYKELSEANFVAALKVFGGDGEAQAELVAARCMDYRVGPGSERVEIRTKGERGDGGEDAGSGEGKELPMVPLKAETERAFDWLRRQCPVNPDLEKHLVSLARLTGGHFGKG